MILLEVTGASLNSIALCNYFLLFLVKLPKLSDLKTLLLKLVDQRIVIALQCSFKSFLFSLHLSNLYHLLCFTKLEVDKKDDIGKDG